jgi:elongation factor Ts
MAEVTAQMIKELREATGAGPLDCKKALEQTGGDMHKAVDFLREKGLAKAAKKLGAGRAMNEGLIEVYMHHNKRIGVIVEVNCETDFVANTPDFQMFAKDLALHIANLAPKYLKREDVPAEEVEHERKIQLARVMDEGKPQNIAEKIVEGRMAKYYEEVVLMEQKFLKDDSKSIEDLLKEVVSKVGESIQISRFARFALGEGETEESAE